MPPPSRGEGRADGPLPERVAAAVLRHPAVARLDGGPFGSVASYLPGRRVVGVRAAEKAPGDDTGGARAGEPVEVSVVVRWPAGSSLPELAGEIAALVRGVTGDRPVDVTVADLVPAPPGPLPGAGAADRSGDDPGGPATGRGPAGTPGMRLA
ncbi:hypothetical protein GCM10023215_05220 [Pseudonocardia yuanmonensis]|uniref:Asp23/Gls24 family envelope stress response protein n=1 Tax=Pseudonocardia yuanmonensis TaxID=1095914 RepID=A0ABP8VYA5_9PSEU